jgi:hypothetical protein
MDFSLLENELLVMRPQKKGGEEGGGCVSLGGLFLVLVVLVLVLLVLLLVLLELLVLVLELLPLAAACSC